LPLQAQGEFALVREELESALALPGQPVKRGTMAHKHIVYMMIADAAAQSRDLEALTRYASLLEELALRDEHLPYLAVAHRSWGVAHRLNKAYDRATARLTKALALFEDLEARWQTGRTLLELGELALAQADQAGARDYYGRALTAFEAMGASPDVQKTREALKALD
jgi:tetratricopeptide (TPR) repeat protein